MFDDGGTALTFTLSGFPRRSHSTWTSRLGGNDPGFPVTMIRGRDTGRRRVHEENQPGYRFSGGADGSDLSPDDSGQSACRGAARPRCPETRRFRHVFGVRLRWPDGHAEFPQLPEGPKQAATERVGVREGVGHNIPSPIVSSEYRRSGFDHRARTAFTVS